MRVKIVSSSLTVRLCIPNAEGAAAIVDGAGRWLAVPLACLLLGIGTFAPEQDKDADKAGVSAAKKARED